MRKESISKIANRSSRLVVLGLDGADWQIISALMDVGRLPNFKRVVEFGVHGPLATLQPTLSPMLWNAIATGKRAGKHGIHGFTEVDEDRKVVRPSTAISRRCKALWNILQQNGKRCHVVNWFAGHPVEPLKGSAISDLYPEGAPNDPDAKWLLRKGTIHPPRLSETLAEYRVHPTEVEDDVLALFIPQISKIDLEKDKRPHTLALELSKAYSVHAAATWLMAHEPWDLLAVYFRAIDLVCHHFMPYHPPAMELIQLEDVQLYGDVVHGIYQMFEYMLGAYLSLMEDDDHCIIVSDHGFQSKRGRPSFHEDPFAHPEAWHRSQGIFIGYGPQFKKDALIHGGCLLDIAPTILSLFGIPAGRDMDGRTLVEAFEAAPELRFVDSWEDVDGDCGMHPAGAKMALEDAEMLVDQFVNLGYINPLSKDQEKAVFETRRCNQWNLARDHLDAGKLLKALPILEDLDHENQGADLAISLHLAHCLQQLGLLPEAEKALQSAMEKISDGPYIQYLRGLIAISRESYDEGLEYFQSIQSREAELPNLRVEIARSYLGLERWEDARKCFEKVLEWDEDNALAYQGLAFVYLKTNQFQLAGGMALKATSLQFNMPRAHFYLGQAMESMGQLESALSAYENALCYAPSMREAHQALADLCGEGSSKLNAPEKQRHHQQIVNHWDQTNARREAHLVEIRAAIRDRFAERRARETRGLGKSAVQVKGQETLVGKMRIGCPVVVSGLPRSGTSLMMKMLEAGGMELLSDGKRKADEDNPEGYFEWESAKKLPHRPDLIREADGKAVKVISMLLGSLPRHYTYKVIFMDRPVSEVVLSQQKMLGRTHGGSMKHDAKTMMTLLAKHRANTLSMIQGLSNIDLIRIPYPELVVEPSKWIGRIVSFIGTERLQDPERMLACIRSDLYRNRVSFEEP